MALLNARDLPAGAVLRSQVCIAGAGAAGITLARELAANGIDVLLLEGGGVDREAASQLLYSGENAGEYEISLLNCRSRHLGGSTNCWEGWCRPLDVDDFEERSWLSGSGWPFDYEALRPYYARARQSVQIGADEFDAASVARRLAATTLDMGEERVRFVLYQYSSPPTRFGSHYLADLTDLGSLTAYTYANVVNIELEANGNAVRALDLSTLEGTRFRAEANYFVIAMGGIENARVLLASNKQLTTGIGNATGLVGAFFMEHPHFYNTAAVAVRGDIDLGFYLNRSRVRTYDESNRLGIDVSVLPAMMLSPATRGAEELVAMAATFRRLNLDTLLGASRNLQASQLRVFLRGAPQDIQLLGLDLRAEQRPTRRSHVSLLNEPDALGVPRVEISWAIEEADIDAAYRTLQLFGAAFAEAKLGRLWIPTEDGHFVPPTVVGGCHHMGTTKMHNDPRQGVVDADSRVHGVDNLFIAGSSVFPTVGFANPTLTILALSYRLADHLLSLSP